MPSFSHLKTARDKLLRVRKCKYTDFIICILLKEKSELVYRNYWNDSKLFVIF